MPFAKVQIPAGFVRNGTEYEIQNRYYGGNLVRFENGRLRPIGGWRRISGTALDGKVRGLLAWRSNDQRTRYVAAGTNTKLYANASGSYVDITPVGFTAGLPDSYAGAGFGRGLFNDQTFGTARTGLTGAATQEAAVWSLDTWGENLVGCMLGEGKLYLWENDTAVKAAAITNAPTGCNGLVVTDERHLMALGAGGNGRKVRWCSREALTTWTASALNTAGSFDLQTYGRALAGIRTRAGVLILTDADAHLASFVGYPSTYAFERIGENAGTIGPQAAVAAGGFGYWMGDGKFYVYDGFVRELECDVHDYVFRDFNQTQRIKVAAGYNSRFGEVTWSYPSAASTENDRYVSYSLREGRWTFGTLARTAWADLSYQPYPIAAGPDGNIYRHEDGWLADGATRVADIYAETGGLELIPNGDNFVYINAIIPDSSMTGAVTLEFETRMFPEGPATTYGPFTLTAASGRTPVRFAANQMKLRIRPSADGDFTIGAFRLEYEIGGPAL